LGVGEQFLGEDPGFNYRQARRIFFEARYSKRRHQMKNLQKAIQIIDREVCLSQDGSKRPLSELGVHWNYNDQHFPVTFPFQSDMATFAAEDFESDLRENLNHVAA